MVVALLTASQKKLIEGKEFAANSLFNPIQDIDGNWIISVEETHQVNKKFEWVKDLPLIDYKPILEDNAS
jgi:hypothetical protein